MEGVGRLAGGIAHDFNNLLTVINGYSEIVLSQMPTDDPSRKFIQEINESGLKAAALTKQLLTFSRQQVIEPKVIDMNARIESSSNMLKRLIGEDIEMSVTAAIALGMICLDPSQFDQLLMNLSVNARDAMPKGGKLFIETSNVFFEDGITRRHDHLKAGNYVMVAVSDTGSGMTPETKARIFEPFFTTKELEKGTGLGLATCYGIVKQNKGYIEVYSELGRGTTFKVYFPRTDKALEEPPKEAAADVRGTETILLVEDERSLRAFSETILKQNGYKVFSMESGDAALRFMADHKQDIHLLLTDVVMPGIGSRDLYEKIKKILPTAKVLYMSGYTEEVVLRYEIENRTANFLQKPFTVSGLLKKVRSVLN